MSILKKYQNGSRFDIPASPHKIDNTAVRLSKVDLSKLKGTLKNTADKELNRGSINKEEHSKILRDINAGTELPGSMKKAEARLQTAKKTAILKKAPNKSEADRKLEKDYFTAVKESNPVLEAIINPMYAVKEGNLPAGFEFAKRNNLALSNTGERLRPDAGAEFINQFTPGRMLQDLEYVPKDLSEGRYTEAGLNALGMFGALKGVGGLAKTAALALRNTRPNLITAPVRGLLNLTGNAAKTRVAPQALNAQQGVDAASVNKNSQVPEQIYTKEVTPFYNRHTGKYDIYEVDVPKYAIPGRSFDDVKHKLKNLRKDLNIGLIEHAFNKAFKVRGPALDQGKGLLGEPSTGRLWDSNTRYWLNRMYGHVPISPFNAENIISSNSGGFKKLIDNIDFDDLETQLRIEKSNLNKKGKGEIKAFNWAAPTVIGGAAALMNNPYRQQNIKQ